MKNLLAILLLLPAFAFAQPKQQVIFDMPTFNGAPGSGSSGVDSAAVKKLIKSTDSTARAADSTVKAIAAKLGVVYPDTAVLNFKLRQKDTLITALLNGYVPVELGSRLFTLQDAEKLDEAYNRPGSDLTGYMKTTDPIPSARIPDGATAFFGATVSMATPTVSMRHLLFTPVAITITDAREITGGTSPSITYSVKYGPNRSNPTGFILNSRTVTSTAGQAATPLVTTTIPANSWIWVEITALSGTINEFGVTITYN